MPPAVHVPIKNKQLKELVAIANALPAIVIVHKLDDFKLEYISERGLKELDATPEELKKLSFQEYHERYFNATDAADYVPKIRLLIERNAQETVTFFQQVRANECSEFKWYLSTFKIWMRDEENRPLYSITLSFQVDPVHHLTKKVTRLLEENNFLREQQGTFSSLSKRECEVLKLIVLGKSNYVIAQDLYISEATVESHRKSIKKKLNAPSYYELSQYAHAFDLI